MDVEAFYPADASLVWDALCAVYAPEPLSAGDAKRERKRRALRKKLPLRAWDPVTRAMQIDVGSEMLYVSVRPVGPTATALRGSGVGVGNRAGATLAFGLLGALGSSGATGANQRLTEAFHVLTTWVSAAMLSRRPPGWYPDPSGHAAFRWWAGTQWTDSYA